MAALAELAGAGPVLELGIGTGRTALPLAERDLEVHGIDASKAMLARLTRYAIERSAWSLELDACTHDEGPV